MAGQLEPEEFPAANNGIFYRNSRIGIRDITDGTSTTLIIGERSRNVAGATWVGMILSGLSCNNPTWPVQDCEASNVLILGHTGPSPDEPWVDVPNNPRAGVDDFHSLHPGGCNFLARRRLRPVRQGDDQSPGLQLPCHARGGRGHRRGPILTRSHTTRRVRTATQAGEAHGWMPAPREVDQLCGFSILRMSSSGLAGLTTWSSKPDSRARRTSSSRP